MEYEIIDGVSYTDRRKILVKAPDNLRGRFVVPTGVKTIQFHAFRNIKNLTEIVIPDSVTNIGCHAFAGCTDLKSITLSEGLANIEAYAFEKCSNLIFVNIPDSTVYIGNCAFAECSELQSLYIPSHVKVTGYYIAEFCHPNFTFFCEGGEGKCWDKKWCRTNPDGRMKQATVNYNVPRRWYEKYIQENKAWHTK